MASIEELRAELGTLTDRVTTVQSREEGENLLAEITRVTNAIADFHKDAGDRLVARARREIEALGS